MPKAELYQRVTKHEAEEVQDCASAILLWRQAVREVNQSFSTERLDFERSMFHMMYSFPSSVYSEAESYLRRSVQ